MDAPIFDWATLTREAASDAQEDLEHVKGRIWTMLVAVVILGLFLLDQLQKTALTFSQLQAIASLLVAAFFGYMSATSLGPSGKGYRMWSAKTKEAKEYLSGLSPFVSSVGVAFLTALAVAWAASGLSPNGLFAGWNVNLVPFMIILFLTLLTALSALFYQVRPGKFVDVMRRTFATQPEKVRKFAKISNAIWFMLYLIACLWYLGGAASGLYESPPSWIEFVKLFGGGSAVFIFEMWLGALVVERNRLRVLSIRLIGLHLGSVDGTIRVEDIPRHYRNIFLMREVPPELRDLLTKKG